MVSGDAALRFGWTKAQLLEKIRVGVWREETLDEQADICYTEGKEIKVENQTNEKNPLRVSRQYLQEPNGRVRHEGLSEKAVLENQFQIACGGHAAWQLINSDYEKYDLLIGMDKANLAGRAGWVPGVA